MDRDKISNLYREPSIYTSYQVSTQLAKRFQRRRFFRNQPIRNKNCLWRPYSLMDQDEMSSLSRGPLIDTSYQVSAHLAKWFQRRRFLRNQPIQGSSNQAKWATSSPWFRWSRPISVKKRSFSHPVSLFNSVFFSPIIILFLQYSHKRKYVPEIWPIQGLYDPYRVWCSISYSKLIICILFKISAARSFLWKVGEHAVVGKETLKFGLIFGSLPDFHSSRP
jgi:hypothetical protein